MGRLRGKGLCGVLLMVLGGGKSERGERVLTVLPHGFCGFIMRFHAFFAVFMVYLSVFVVITVFGFCFCFSQISRLWRSFSQVYNFIGLKNSKWFQYHMILIK